MEPPQLPCEVIERIIGHSSDHPDTLNSFSFTCSRLRPRALCLMVGRVTLWSRNRTFAFVDFVRAKPHLKPLVRSIVVDPTEFAPFPLLHILPNLSEIEFTSWLLSRNILALHPSCLTCFQRFGTQIQTLHLSGLSFATYLPFARLLLAFANISHLTCTDVVIQTAGDGPPLAVVQRRLSEQMRLKTLTMSAPQRLAGAIVPRWLPCSSSQTHSSSLLQRGASVCAFLFHPDLIPSTVENLRLMGAEPDAFFNLSSWSRLRSLVLRLPYDHRLLTSAAKLLEEFHSPTLAEVMLELHSAPSVLHVLRDLSCSGQLEFRPDIPQGLERALLRFPQPRMTWIVSEPLRVGRHSFWICELGKQFPVLFQRGALELKSRTAFPAGHDALIHAFVASPDGTWVASGSDDGTASSGTFKMGR
ncbi:hypothetical protein LXA43DRAFT_991900 [Ganoderma leucocontextum]|nr:hypothetical protein LXA43DRAFT_991900 [Ganoderma leucocontextum]